MRARLAGPLLLALAASAWAASPSASEVRLLLEQRFAEDASDKVRAAAARLLSPAGHGAARALLLELLVQEPGGLGLFDDALAGLAATGGEHVTQALLDRIPAASTPILRAKVARVCFPLAPEAALAVTRAVLEDPARPAEARLARELAGPATQLGGAMGLEALTLAYRRYGADQAAGAALVQGLLQLDPARAEGLVREAGASPRWTARQGAARHLSRFPAAVAAPLLGGLLAHDPHLEVRQAAAESLLGKDPARLGELATALFPDASLGETFRALLADWLGTLGWVPAEDLLLEAFSGGGPLLRAAAARGLGGMGSLRGAGPMLAVLGAHDAPDPHWLRTWCARGLAGIRTLEVRAGLGEALRHDSIGYVLEAAARSLAAHRHQDAFAELRASADPVWPLESRVAALGQLGADPASLRLLQDTVLEDPAPAARAAAAGALGSQAGPGRLGPLLSAVGDAHGGVRAAALQALARQPEWAFQAGPAAETRLRTGPEEDERLAAAQVLAKAGGPRAAAALARAAVSDGSRSVRIRCLGSLEAVSLDEAVAAWRRALAGDPEKAVRLMAASALGRLDPGTAWPELRGAALRDPDPYVRRGAVLAVAALLAGQSL